MPAVAQNFCLTMPKSCLTTFAKTSDAWNLAARGTHRTDAALIQDQGHQIIHHSESLFLPSLLSLKFGPGGKCWRMGQEDEGQRFGLQKCPILVGQQRISVDESPRNYTLMGDVGWVMLQLPPQDGVVNKGLSSILFTRQSSPQYCIKSWWWVVQNY